MLVVSVIFGTAQINGWLELSLPCQMFFGTHQWLVRVGRRPSRLSLLAPMAASFFMKLGIYVQFFYDITRRWMRSFRRGIGLAICLIRFHFNTVWSEELEKMQIRIDNHAIAILPVAAAAPPAAAIAAPVLAILPPAEPPCTHFFTTRRGSNRHFNRHTCLTCGHVSRTPV